MLSRPRTSRHVFLWVGVALSLAFTACSPTVKHSRFHGDTNLHIAVYSDEPGLGYLDNDAAYSGLDIAVADYVMKRLGITASSHNLFPVNTADRDNLLLQRKDDLVIASYSITDGRIGKGISFTRPYLVTYQGILVRAEDAHTITTVNDLQHRVVCTGPETSTPYQHLALLNQQRDLHITILPETASQTCVTKLAHREDHVSAFVTDDAIASGYLLQNPDLRLTNTKIYPRPEQYGIGLIADGRQDIAELDTALNQMINDGSWKKAVIAGFCGDHQPTAAPCPAAQTLLSSPPPSQ